MGKRSILSILTAMLVLSSGCGYVSSVYEVDVLYRKKDKEHIAKFLKDNDPYAREKAVVSMINLGECSDRVYAASSDPDPIVRAALVKTLIKCNNEASLDIYLNLAKDESPRVRKEVAVAAIQNDHCRGDCLFTLRELLNDKDHFVKLVSAKALRKRFPTEAHFAVLDSISNDLFIVKKEALEILPLFKQKEDIKYLTEFLNSPDSQIRIATRVAIEKIMERSLSEEDLAALGGGRVSEVSSSRDTSGQVALNPVKKKIVVVDREPSLKDFGIRGTGTIDDHAIAVIIGNKDYESIDIPDVNYAVRDAKIMREVAQHVLGARNESVVYIENAKKADFDRVFGTAQKPRGLLASWAKAGSKIFIFYSGHGAPDTNDKKAYLVPVDSDVNFLKRSGYPLELLYKNLGALQAETITLALDACFSGVTQGGALTKSASPVFVSVQNPLISANSNMVVMTSSKSDEISTWDNENKYGLFTYHFVNSLKEGDADRNGRITVNEIERYVSKRVSLDAWRLMNREQNPQTFGVKENVFAQIKRP